jgi:23S rRNA pseudouridine1911/1915/1917 synthase
MSDYVEICWLKDESSLKLALQETLHCSGQLIKKYFSSKEHVKPLRARQVTVLPLTLVNHMRINPVYIGPELRLITENKEMIVLHKPPRIHGHPHSYEDQNTLLNFLAHKHIWQPLEVNAENYDRGLLYRLDYETSGVMVIAKSEMFFQSMRQNFESSVKRKFYWAIVEGDFNQEGRWTHYLRPEGLKGLKQKVSNVNTGESHEGTLTVLKVMFQSGKSLLLINLKTGLRHQIRAQLAHLGFPIVGDYLYGKSQGERLFLHAFRYEFTHVVEDPEAELFNLFFDLNSTLKMTHDMLGRF